MDARSWPKSRNVIDQTNRRVGNTMTTQDLWIPPWRQPRYFKEKYYDEEMEKERRASEMRQRLVEALLGSK